MFITIIQALGYLLQEALTGKLKNLSFTYCGFFSPKAEQSV